MEIYTIGFTERTAEEFFEPLKEEGVELLIDIRLNNTSQLSGFAKGRDLKYFLKVICGCDYDHNEQLSPTKEIMKEYRSGNIVWGEYRERFFPLIEKRGELEIFAKKYAGYKKVCLLCSEYDPTYCHRSLIAEILQGKNPSWVIKHL